MISPTFNFGVSFQNFQVIFKRMSRKIFFLKQSGIVSGQSHVEDHISSALAESNLEATVFDVVGELRTFRPQAACSRKEVLHAYEDYILDRMRISAADWILVLGGYALENLFPGIFARIKLAGHRIASWHADDPYYLDLQEPIAPSFDHIFTVDKSAVAHWNARGVRCEYLPFGCSPSTNRSLSQTDLSAYACDLSFIGAPFAGSQRVKTIDRNADFLSRYDTRIFGATKVDSWQANLSGYPILSSKISDRFLDPGEANRYYKAARINLNLHKDSYGHCWDHNSAKIQATSPNERFFFVAGLGGFQLIDRSRPDLFSLFPEDLLCTFDNDASFRERIVYFLKNDRERIDKAAALQEIMLEHHTYGHRIQTMLASL